MNNYQKLVEKLKEVEDIKKDLKELRFGCIVNDTNYGTGLSQIFGELGRNFIVKRFEDLSKPYIERKSDVEDWEIIGNPLELHHLIWFCENKNIKLSLQTQFLGNLKQTMLFFNRNGCCKYDTKKPLHQQSEEVLKNIFEALIG